MYALTLTPFRDDKGGSCVFACVSLCVVMADSYEMLYLKKRKKRKKQSGDGKIKCFLSDLILFSVCTSFEKNY